MAIYENQCTKCNHYFTTMTSKPTDKLEKCPECNGVAQRLISKSTFSLKDGGVGWADKSYSGK